MRLTKPIGRLIYCHSSAPDRILGDVLFRDDHSLTIGRSSDNNVCLEKQYISGNHAEIVANENRFWLKNLKHDHGVRRYAQRLRSSEQVVLQQGDYFSLPGKNLGDPEERYICLFIYIDDQRTMNRIDYKPISPDPVDVNMLHVFGSVVRMQTFYRKIFDYLQEQRGHFAAYNDIAEVLWGIREGYDEATVARYINWIRQKLDNVLSQMENPPVLLFPERHRHQQEEKIRLCLDDVLPALEQHALHHELDEALIQEIQTGDKGYVVLPAPHEQL